jgi:hypothetical protein
MLWFLNAIVSEDGLTVKPKPVILLCGLVVYDWCVWVYKYEICYVDRLWKHVQIMYDSVITKCFDRVKRFEVKYDQYI